MKHQARTLAQIASLASTAEDLLKSPQPLRRDKLRGRVVQEEFGFLGDLAHPLFACRA